MDTRWLAYNNVGAMLKVFMSCILSGLSRRPGLCATYHIVTCCLTKSPGVVRKRIHTKQMTNKEKEAAEDRQTDRYSSTSHRSIALSPGIPHASLNDLDKESVSRDNSFSRSL